MDLSIQSLSLIAALAICAYLTFLCSTPPNPNPKQGTVEEDRIAPYANPSKAVGFKVSFFWLYHTLLVLFPDNRSRFCMNPELLNKNLFSWTWASVTFIVVIFIAAPIRLLAYSQLGKNFTFRLEKPKNLVKNGLYAYVQHPSYPSLLLVVAAGSFFWLRLDGVAACLLPSFLVMIKSLSEILALGIIAVVGFGVWLRVKDEEAMLKKEFGKEWIEYHSKTKRFIPWVI